MKFKHDAANYVEQIEYLVAHKDEQSDDLIKNMVDELKDRVNTISSKVFCRDPLINAVLTLKANKCTELGIPFSFRATTPDPEIEVDVEPLDQSSIMSNIIDNAINSAVVCKNSGLDASVALNVGMMGDLVAVRVENPTVYDGEIHDIKSLIKMSRSAEHKEGHGYGLLIVSEKAAKYSCDLVVDIKDHKCVIVITMPTKKKEGSADV